MMKNWSLVFLFMICGVLYVSCGSDNDAQICDQRVVIDATEYTTAPMDALVIGSLTFNGDCLEITFSAGGCDGKSWELKLIDSGAISESLPPQRNLILSLKNDEFCEALITQTLTVDIAPLQIEGSSIQLNLVNTGDEILYTYGS
ncbi:MAG: hypothetical protein AAGA85_25410 [Bacteroidota bacterium]